MNQLSRKEFLKLSGVMITLPSFLEMCSTIHPRLLGDTDDPILNADSNGFKFPIIKAISTGITAPNPHNVQPWKFKIISSTEMLLYVDEKRILPITDPPKRQIHIGQGTFLELLKVGANKLSYNAKIDLFPEGEYKVEDLGKKPIAKVSLHPEKNIQSKLYEFVTKRATDRSEYHGDYITDSESKMLAQAGKPEKSELNFILGKSEMMPFLELFYKAMEIESYNPHLNEESRIWFRFSDKEILEKRDGIALPDQGVTGISRFIAEKFFMSSDPESFNNKSGLEIFLSRYRKKIDSSKGIVYWKTKTNSIKDWVQVGMDYARFQLAITGLGYKMHPFSQILQEYPEMDRLRMEFDERMGISSKEKIQMIARIGRGDYNYLTPRRELKSFLL
jgi:hypothetical protein